MKTPCFGGFGGRAGSVQQRLCQECKPSGAFLCDSPQNPDIVQDCLLKCSCELWARSQGHPHTEGAFTGTRPNVGDLRWNSGECQQGSCEYGCVDHQSLPNFARHRQVRIKGAHASCTSFGDFLAGALYREFREFMRILTNFLGKAHRNPS